MAEGKIGLKEILLILAGVSVVGVLGFVLIGMLKARAEKEGIPCTAPKYKAGQQVRTVRYTDLKGAPTEDSWTVRSIPDQHVGTVKDCRISANKEWYQVSIDGAVGWLKSEDIEAWTQPSLPPELKAGVCIELLWDYNVTREPADFTTVIGKVSKGTRGKLTGEPKFVGAWDCYPVEFTTPWFKLQGWIAGGGLNRGFKIIPCEQPKSTSSISAYQ